jgi:predicted dehydrogenase
MKKIGYAVLGLGIGMAHADAAAASENAELVAVCDRDEKRLEKAKALYPSVDYTLVTEEGVTYACYNFGNALFYDPVSGQCRAAEDAFASEFSSEV